MGVGIYLKHNLFKNEEKKRWVSIVPGINMVKGGRGITIGDSKPLNIGSFGLTIPLIITQGNKQTNKSFIARYSIDWLRVGKTHYPINRFNTSVSFQNKHRHLIVTLELGAEHVFEGSNFVKSVPSIGIALGLPSKE
ncbi:MAG: hypothetical protein B6226_00160 [Candidatus Cloacimonetes bacterium 4572_65]|nr:MAG: hypothetical protein B6226_00160 [Candidatus Cloacimonetes bacterium 4572_65]